MPLILYFADTLTRSETIMQHMQREVASLQACCKAGLAVRAVETLIVALETKTIISAPCAIGTYQRLALGCHVFVASQVKFGVLPARVLSELTSAYLQARVPDAGPGVPKLHQAMHLGPQSEEIMLDCFVHERKHQDVKDLGGSITTPAVQCHSVMKYGIWQQVLECVNASANFFGVTQNV